MRVLLVLSLASLAACGRTASYESSVRSYFADPDAVQFRKVQLASGYLCGELNAKNGFNAYVGFRPFIADLKPDGTYAPDFGPEQAITEAEFPSRDQMNRHACAYQRRERRRTGMQTESIPQCDWIDEDERAYAQTRAFDQKYARCAAGN